MVNASNPSTWVIDAAGSGVEGHPWLHSKLEVSLGCLRSYLKRHCKQLEYDAPSRHSPVY